MKRVFIQSILLTLLGSSFVYGESTCNNSSQYIKGFASATNPEAFNLAWARCEKSLGNESAALSAYERVLFYNPTNTEAITALVPLYRATGMGEEAKNILEGINMATLSPNEKEQITKLKGGGDFDLVTKFEGEIEYGYDTNINYNIFAEDALLPVSEAQKSSFYAVDLKGSFSHRLESNDAFSLQSHVELYYKDNKESDYFDIAHGKLDLGIGYDTSKFSLYFPLAYSRMNYLGRDLYEQYGVAPRVTMSLGDELLLNLGAKYLVREYISTADQNSNDTMTSGSVGLYRFFGDDFVYLQFDYGRNEADATLPAFFSGYDFLNLFAGVSHELKAYHITLGVDYLYSKRQYDDTVVATTQTREDEYHQLKLSLKRKINTHWTMKFEYSYLDNTSNYPLIDYNKNLMSMSFHYNY